MEQLAYLDKILLSVLVFSLSMSLGWLPYTSRLYLPVAEPVNPNGASIWLFLLK